MSDKLGGNFSFDTYINKQEGLLVDFIRRHLQSETKVLLLESALQDMYKKNEELANQLEINKTTIDQSVVGLQAVTLERDRLNARITELEKALNNSNNERNDFQSRANESSNRAAILENEIRQLNNKIEVANNDYATLKENYSRVLAALDDTNKKLEAVQPQNAVEVIVPVKQKRQVKKTPETDSEWVDGEYKIST